MYLKVQHSVLGQLLRWVNTIKHSTDPALCSHLCVVESNWLRVCHQQRFLHPIKFLLFILRLCVQHSMERGCFTQLHNLHYTIMHVEIENVKTNISQSRFTFLQYIQLIRYWSESCVRQRFLRATAYSAYMLSPVRLSVCRSVTRVDQLKTVEVMSMQFSPYGSPIALVFAG